MRTPAGLRCRQCRRRSRLPCTAERGCLRSDAMQIRAAAPPPPASSWPPPPPPFSWPPPPAALSMPPGTKRLLVSVRTCVRWHGVLQCTEKDSSVRRTAARVLQEYSSTPTCGALRGTEGAPPHSQRCASAATRLDDTQEVDSRGLEVLGLDVRDERLPSRVALDRRELQTSNFDDAVHFFYDGKRSKIGVWLKQKVPKRCPRGPCFAPSWYPLGTPAGTTAHTDAHREDRTAPPHSPP